MAHTIDYWHNYLIQKKQAQPELAVFTSTSNTSRWKLYLYIQAVCIVAFEIVLDLFKIDVQTLITKQRQGKLGWYIDTSKIFQYGDNIVGSYLTWSYPVIDETKQIVQLISPSENENGILLKVAKLVGSAPAPLNASEMTAFQAFWKDEKVGIAGIPIDFISANADDLQLYLTVIYDPQVLSSTGELLSSPGTYPVEDAINAYLQFFGTDLGFNTEFDTMQVINAIENTNMVISAYCDEAKARYGAMPFVAFPRRYLANSGYAKIDAASPLSTTITYIANV